MGKKHICVGDFCTLTKTVGILFKNERVKVISSKNKKKPPQVKVRNICGIERMVATKYLKLSPN